MKKILSNNARIISHLVGLTISEIVFLLILPEYTRTLPAQITILISNYLYIEFFLKISGLNKDFENIKDSE